MRAAWQLVCRAPVEPSASIFWAIVAREWIEIGSRNLRISLRWPPWISVIENHPIRIRRPPTRDTPRETSDYTSIKQRLGHVEARGANRPIGSDEGLQGCRIACRGRFGIVALALSDRGSPRSRSIREGMMQGFSLGSYVQLVDYTGRVFRQGKASISSGAGWDLRAAGGSAQTWQARMNKLRDGRLLGRFFATTHAKLREIAERLGMRRQVNLAGCPAR